MTPPSNPLAKQAVVMLERAGKKNQAPIWLAASRRLGSPAATKVQVNVGKISRLTAAGGAVFVPGKVLGTGTIDKKIEIGAFSYSASARAKIEASGGSAMTVEEFLVKHPKGSGVRLVE
jgi:large subunit ribosomal protein L18e